MGKKHQSTVRSYQPADEQETHDGDDTLTATPILPPFAYPPPFDSHLWEENPYTLQEEVSKLLECNRTAFNTQPPTFVNLQHGPEDPAHTVRWSPSGQLIATVSAGTADRSGMVIIHDRTPNSSGALPVVSNFEAPQDAIRGKKCATRLHVMDWARPGDTYLVVGGVAVYDEISAFCRVFIVEAATGRLMWQYGGGMGCSEDAELTTEQHLSFNWNSSILCFALGAPRGLPGKVLVFNVDSSRFPTKGENPVTAKADKVWLLGDYDDVSRVRWGPKGDLQDRLAVAVITRKRTGKLYIMDASTGVISQVYDQHQTPIAQLYWFPSRQWTPTSPVISPERICSLDTEGQLHVLSSHTLYGSVILTPHAIDDSVKQGETQLIVTVIDSPIKIFCLAAYGLRILTGHADGTVRCFGSFSGVELSTFRAHVPKTPIGSLDWTTNDQYIASLSTADAEQNRLCIWPSSIFETPAFENRFVPDDTVKRSILRTAISPEGTHLACAQRGGWVSITKMESGRVRGRKEATGFYHVDTRSSQLFFFVNFNPGKNQSPPKLATCVWGLSKVHMLDGDTCRPLWILGDSTAGPPLEMIRDQGFSPCGTYLAIAHGKLNSPEVTVLAAETGQQVWRLSERVNKDMPGQMILALAFSPDGTRIAVGGAGQEVPEQEVALERAIAEDEDDVMTDANVYVYKVENGSVESKHAHGLRLRSLCWSPDSSVLALGGDGVKGVALVDPAESGSTVLRLKAYKQVCFSLTFSNDGTQLACGFNNDEVCVVYNLPDQRMIDFFPGRGPVHFSPEGNALLYGGKVERWVHARLNAHVQPVESLTKSVLGFIRCKSAVQKFPLDECLRFSHHRLFSGKGPKGGGLLHIAIAGLKHKQSAFTVADVHRIIEANPVACLAAIGSMDEPIDEPQTPLHQAIERGWQSIFSKMFEVLATVNPNSTTLPPYSHKMLQIQRAGIQSTAQLLIEEYPRYQSVAVLCLSLLMSDPPGCLRGIPKGAHDYALTVKDKAALTDETWEELVDEDPRDAQFQLEPLTTYKPPESNPFEVSVEAAKCRPHILEKDLWAGSEYKLRVITFPSRGLQDAIMASREAALVFHPLFTSTVRAKWIFFGQKYAFVEVILMAFFLCSFIAWGSLAHGCPPSHPTEEQDVSQERTYLICTTTNTDELSHLISLYVMWWTITLLMCGFYAFKELREGVSLAYFTDAFNIIDMFNLLLTVALLITDAASRFPAFSANDIDAATAQAEWPVVYLLSLSLLLHFVRLIDKYRAFKIFGTYIRALLQIFADMFGFIFLLLTLNAAFAIVFYWLFNADAADEDRGHPGGLDLEMSFLKSFTVGVLGEFGFDDLAGFPRFLVVIVIILWVVINIVMLNSLIALVSESWANITGERELNSRIERGTILNNIEAFWYRKAAPQFLFVAERGEPELLAEETQGESPEESEGLVGTMQRDTLKALIEEILAPLKSEISSLQKNRTVWGSPGPGGEGGGAPASSI